MKKFAAFTITDAYTWQDYVDKNLQGYGYAILEYAAQWASLVEDALKTGSVFEEVVGPLSHEADTDDITGFMHGAAVATLSKVWKHGEALRKWSNSNIAPDQAEEVNAIPGTVINPALMTIQLPEDDSAE